jgi:hypothetical protein
VCVCVCVAVIPAVYSRSQWTRRLRRGSAAAHLLGLRVRFPPGAWLCVVRQRSLRRAHHSSRGVLWMSVSCQCCVLSGTGLCNRPIPRLEEFYRCLSVVCCQRSLRRADPSSRGVLLMTVSCKCCVLSSRGLCDGPILFPEESYGCLSLVSVVCCQVEVSATGRSLYQRSPMDVCLL